MYSSTALRTLLCLALMFALLAATVSFAYAQSTGDEELRSTIRAAIVADPRSEGMTEAEIDAMMEALTRQANLHGITAQDVARAAGMVQGFAGGEGVADTCGSLCKMSQAFGFDGSDMAVPIGLGITSALLLFVIGSLLLHRHGHHPLAGEVGTPPSSTGPSS